MTPRSSGTILVAVFLAACASFAAVGGKVAVPGQGFEVDLPQGWTRIWDPTLISKDVQPLLLTRDGFVLQGISIGREPIQQALPNSKKKFVAGMSPAEAAEVEVEDLRASSEVVNLELLESTPASIGERPGFRLVFVWKTKGDLRMKRLQYGVLDGPWVYRLIYYGTARYYFDRDVTPFEQVVRSFRLLVKSS